MLVSTRAYLTAGVAAVGAGAIALAPVQPINAPVLAPELVKSLAVNLASSIDPITPIIDTVTNTIDNTALLLTNWLETPVPILQTIVGNWLYYFTELPDIGTIVSQVVGNIGNAIQAPFDPGQIGFNEQFPLLAAGENISTLPLVGQLSQRNLYNLLPVLAPGFVGPQQSLLNFLNTPISGTLLGLVGPVVAPFVSLGNDLGAAVAAIQALDIVGAINAIINIPTNMVNALLNGGPILDLTPLFSSDLPPSTSVGITLGGLLTGFVSPVDPAQTQVGGVGFDSITASVGAGPSAINFPGIPIGLVGGLNSLNRYVASAINRVPTAEPASARGAVKAAAAAAVEAGAEDPAVKAGAEDPAVEAGPTPVTSRAGRAHATSAKSGGTAGRSAKAAASR